MDTNETNDSVQDMITIGDLEPEELAAKLREMGDEEAAAEIEESQYARDLDSLFDESKRKAYRYRTHQIGYFPLRQPRYDAPIPIRAIGVIDPDPSLLNNRIDIHLDRLYVEQYPGKFFGGGGEHHIMVNFTARNHLPNVTNPETVAFSQTYMAFDGDEAGVLGYPVFIGLNVGGMGAAFGISTINVKNTEDEAILKMLDSNEFRNGLSLLNTAQPAIAPLTKLAIETTRLLAGRSKNVSVQNFYLGLDAKMAAAGGPLVAGNFIVAQVPGPNEIDWSKYHFDPNTGTVRRREGDRRGLRYNYLIFRVTKH